LEGEQVAADGFSFSSIAKSVVTGTSNLPDVASL
jgi:hypothetical protein